MSRFIAIDVDAAGLFVTSGFAKGNSVRIEQALAVVEDPRPLTPDSAPELGRRLKELLSASRTPAAPNSARISARSMNSTAAPRSARITMARRSIGCPKARPAPSA